MNHESTTQSLRRILVLVAVCSLGLSSWMSAAQAQDGNRRGSGPAARDESTDGDDESTDGGDESTDSEVEVTDSGEADSTESESRASDSGESDSNAADSENTAEGDEADTETQSADTIRVRVDARPPAERSGGPALVRRSDVPDLRRFPLRAIDRPAVLRSGVLRLSADSYFRYARVDEGIATAEPDTSVRLNGGFAYGLADRLTIGATPFPTEIWPDTVLQNPSLFAGFGLISGVLDLAIYGRATFPIQDENSNIVVDVYVPVWLELGDSLQLRTGGLVALDFGDEVDLDIRADLGLLAQLADNAYIVAMSYWTLYRFDWEQLFVGAEVRSGFTVPAQFGPAADLFVRFALPRFVRPANDRRPFDIGSFEAGGGVQFYFYQ